MSSGEKDQNGEKIARKKRKERQGLSLPIDFWEATQASKALVNEETREPIGKGTLMNHCGKPKRKKGGNGETHKLQGNAKNKRGRAWQLLCNRRTQKESSEG